MGDIVLPRIYAPDEKRPVEANKFLGDFSARAYHSDREAVSQGCLAEVVYQSPAHFLEKWAQPYKEIDGGPAMRLGSICHHALLEPEVYADYMVQPNLGDGRTKAGKAARAEWIGSLPAEWLDVATDEETGKESKAINGSALIVSPAEKNAVEYMVSNVLDHPRVKALGLFAEHPLTEQTVYWVDEATGILQRARIDLVTPRLNTVWDFKTTESAHKRDFARRVDDNRYAFQGAHYTRAAEAAGDHQEGTQHLMADPSYVFIAVERTAPFSVAVYNLVPRALQLGEAMRREALTKLRECIVNRKWPGYSVRVEDIDLPAYRYTQAPLIEANF